MRTTFDKLSRAVLRTRKGQSYLETYKIAAMAPVPPAGDGAFAALFRAHEGRVVHKWESFLPAYDSLMAPYRGSPVRLLEIGVSKGGSLQLWRKYFGAGATIFGVDVNPACAAVSGPENQVRIGSQADPAFLAAVVDEMQGIDIVIDDGSHVGRHQRASFLTLFPRLNNGGLYVIEDLHTAYWSEWRGGYRRPGTGIELCKELIDGMHGWYHDKPGFYPPAKEEIRSIAFFDSIAAIHKSRSGPPKQIVAGSR